VQAFFAIRLLFPAHILSNILIFVNVCNGFSMVQ